MRKLLIGVGVLILIIAGAVGWLWSNMDSLVKTAIETVGSKVAGVPVTVSKVSLDIRNGKGTIEGLTVANPQGFTSKSAFALGAISVALDPASVTKSPIKITDVTISAPAVTYEVTAQGGSNINAIKQNVDNFSAANAKTESKPAPAASSSSSSSADSGKGTSLVVDKLSITDGKVTLATPVAGVAATAPLPTIVLKDIGKNKGGASPADVAEQVLDALSSAAMKSGSSLALGNLAGAAKGAAGDAVQGATDQLKGLFGK